MPEGDTIHKAARRVHDALTGRTLVDVALPRVATPALRAGATVVEATSHGKFLVVHLDTAAGDPGALAIVTHLKMTGQWLLLPADARRPPASRLRVWLATEHVVAACIDAPVADLVDAEALRRHPGLRALGPDLCRLALDDPADRTAALDAVIARAGRFTVRGAPISDMLLDQRIAAGIGNVYKSEICFLHGLHPLVPSQQVDNETRRALFTTGAELLQANLETSRRTTVTGGRPGALWVYGRAGRACRRCGATIEGERTGRQHRVTSWCPSCQPAP